MFEYIKNNIIREIKEKILDFLYFWKLLFKRICRSISWAVFMFKNEDWDYEYFFKVVNKKLMSMEKELKKGGHVSSKSISRIIRLMLEYLRLSRDEDLGQSVYDLFEKKYGHNHIDMSKVSTYDKNGNPLTYSVKFGFKIDNGIIFWEGEPEYEKRSNIYYRITRFVDYKRTKYKHRFFYMLEKYINYMWD